MDVLAHLKELSAAPGLSGYESPVREVIRTAWAPLTTEIHVDRLGSLWATKAGAGKGPRPKIMLAAHMDSIGLMVTKIEGEFLRVTSVGGIDARVMPGQLVTVHAKEDLPGLVAQPAAFLLPKANREGVVPLGELVVDVGLPADKVASLVRVGDVISFAMPPCELQGDMLAARYMDNRSSVAALTVCLDHLQTRPHTWDVIAVATVQEEVGLKGAMTSAFALNPAIAIAVDVTFGIGAGVKDQPDRTFALGGGPVIAYGPNLHPALAAAIQATASRAEIPHTTESLALHSGTDAFGIQIAREGIPTACLSLPLRNMHTPVEQLSTKDVARTGRLISEFIVGLQEDFVSTLTFD